MHDVCLAFFWHQHQPYYPDALGAGNPMPWVRLHGVKDYWGMAMLLAEFPKMRATINLVPSLLVQLADYTERGYEDTHLKVSRLPPDGLAAADMQFLLENFFMAHADRMIRPFPRYAELLEKRGPAHEPIERAAKRFQRRDILDLQCWSNLAWFHPIAFERDPDLAEFRRKGRHWTEEEKRWLLDRQLALLKEVVPLHRQLQRQGQIELTTTPFYHPILPLLWDKRLARRAMPDAPLPTNLDGYPEDAREHVRRAVAYHEQAFGRPPEGMWPAEGSVCQPMIPALAEAGIRWIATDEEILFRSTDGYVGRDGAGYLRNPEALYRPWRLEEAGRQLQIVFRDHAMSDLIGFQYQRYAPTQAVDDFVGKLEAIGRATRANSGQRPTLVSIILDGENCWEYYPNSGVEFLRGLYWAVTSHPKISPVRIGEYLQSHPATDKIANLFPGSWIQHNFGIWIGGSQCNRAWDLLHRTRGDLARAAGEGRVEPERLRQAWEELYIAEGSDWFWWFHDSHHCAQNDVFDRLYRKHLQNVYHALGQEPPADLAVPLIQGVAARTYSLPTGLLAVRVDGRRTYFEWINAGRYVCQGGRGAMNLAVEPYASDLYFGSDTRRLLLRLDARGGHWLERLTAIDRLRVVFFRPEGYELAVEGPCRRAPILSLRGPAQPASPRPAAALSAPSAAPPARAAASDLEAAADAILEMAIPFSELGVSVDAPLEFYVELESRGAVVQRIPAEGAIETTVPSADFELLMWQA